MSGWHSLSGHLHYRTRGALSILKPKRRMWFMFEESQCKLMFYNSEADARRKPAIGQICIRGAAITLDLEQHNQFVIISDAKDHVLTAENHESLMIWVIGLQAKRDACINRSVSPTGVRVSSLWSSESNIRKHKSCDWLANGDVRNNFSHHEPLKRSNTVGGPNSRQQFASGHRLVRQADSYNGIESCDKAACESKAFVTRPLSRSVTEEDLDSARNEGEQLWSKGRVSSNESLDNHEDNDDVFGENYATKNSEEKLRLTRHKQDEMSENSSKQNCDTINGYERTSSCSGLSSGSTDSAIDKGLNDPHQELLGRMAELEQELITTKCELAKVLNQQTFFQEVLEKKDAIIEELDDTLDQLGVADFKRNLLYGGKFMSKKKGKVLEERVRVLQNQNRFLNEEVKRLVKNRQSEQDRFRHQEERLQSFEAEIEGWKRNYVSIVQSCIHYPTGDAMDGADVTLYGEDTHKVTIKGLLAEARRTNPSLPTFERLASSPYHVDSYGFKHSHENTGLLLHYICQQLNLHYTMQLANYEQHQLRWKEYLCQHRDFTRSDKELKELCRGGIPHQYRKEVWRRLVYTQVQDLRKEKGCHFYRNLCNSLPDSQLAARYRKQISLDLMRTMPSNVKFSSVGSKGIHDLQDVLLAFCVHNPSVGYCQGLNFIVAMALLIMEPQDAFWTLIAVTEKYFSPNYFNHNLIGAQADQEVLREIILDKLPRLYQHLEDIDIEISTVTLNWFMAVFFDAVPFETLLRLWDCFLLEGPKVLFRFALAILKLHENDLLQKNDTISVMRHLKACAKLTYDADRLIKTAFEDLSPFPSRRDISVKQTCYLNVLKEKYKKREWHKRAYTEREQMLLEQKADSENSMLIECVACYDEGKLWLCHCANNVSNMCKVNCEENLMYTLNLQFQARILCMKALRQDIMLIGTVAWTLFAYDTRSREEKWQLQLHDAVMSLCVLKEGRHRRVFAGLADGTVAVIEHVRSTLPKTDVFYVPVGKSSVTSMTLVNDQLWCASGNMVYVLHARTLDAMDNFTVSANPYDQVLTLVAGEFGMWISLKGSSILELWDIKALSCKMLYDTRTCRYPNLRKEDDSYFNKARITSVLADNTCVMVGTGEGVMITFEVVERTPPKSSPEGSSCSDSRSSSPFWSTNQKHPNLAFDRNSQDKIKDYLKRLDEGQRWDENGEDWNNGEGKRFRDFDNISYPSSLACSEISNSVSNQDSSVQDKGVNPSENEQEQVLRDGSGNESFLDVEVPSLSTPTADGKTLFVSEQLSADVGDNCAVQSKAIHVTKEIDIALVNKTQDMNNGNYNENLMRNSNKVRSKNQDLESDLNNDEELSEKGFFVDEFVSDPDFANNNNIPKISVIEDNRNSDRDDSENCLSVEQDFTTSVGSSESFRSCEEKDDAIETTNEDKTLAEDQPEQPANTTDFFEDDVFYEAVSGTSFENKQTLKPGETALESANKEIPSVSPSPEKEKSRSRMSRIKRRSKKLTSEVQYRLDFSDMKLSIDSNLSSSSFSERNSSLLSNFYPSDSSLDQLKSSLRVDNSLANSYSKSEDQIDMSTTRPVVVKSQRPAAGHLASGFKRVSASLDAHIDSLGLSSLDDVSSHKESSETKDRLTVKTQISHNSSATSLCSLTEAQLYAYDLCLQSKVKIADKPVKCLLATSVKKEPVMISCAGCYGDDEAVLRWRKEPQEKMWTNEPIYEICEKTRETRLPSYMMHRRMSSVSSSHSAESQSSISSVVACGNT